jgi:uncharacterized protein (UPF0548 family)
MRIVWRPTDAALERALRSLQTQDLSYEEVGATQGSLPHGYRHVSRTEIVGRGIDDFERAARALNGWDMHRGAGFLVAATSRTAEVGGSVLMAAPFGLLGVLIPCRVVATVNEENRRGFVYGTLPGHPELGEESFTVRRDPPGHVSLEIISFSRSGSVLVRGHAARVLQDQYTNRYFKSLRRLARSKE